MVPKELRIRKGDIEIAITFDTKEQLEEQLKDYDEIISVVKDKLGVSFESKKVRKDLEGICDFENNKVVLIKSPSSQVMKVCLVLYAYGPAGTTLKDISLSTGIRNPSRNVLSIKSYKKYFRKISKDKHALSDAGISYITSTIIPELKGENQGN